ncbi:TPA: hypothetical protein LA462_000964 [Clostridium botulinum]|nr:hypothetical protein [Clostridium botulinum]
MGKINNLWFNEDDDMVYGYKNTFESKEEFVKEANRVHVEQTGYGCIVDEIKCNVCLVTEDTLKGESIYLLEESGAEVITLYYSDCESLENYDLRNGDGTVEIEDGRINLQGERVGKCDICGCVMSYDDYKMNNGFCDVCASDMNL